MPLCGHTGDTLRGWSDSHVFPTNTFYPPGRYGSALAELNSTLTPLSARWCVRNSYRQVDPLAFRPRQAHILQTSVKPQHLCSENHTTGNALRSAPSSPIPNRLFRAHPRQSTQNAFSCQFLPHSHQEPLFPSQHMHREAQRIYMLIYIVVGQSRT
jgi:hypothetical protein